MQDITKCNTFSDNFLPKFYFPNYIFFKNKNLNTWFINKSEIVTILYHEKKY